ncbi:GNAT family N-acetyltransferase [Oryzibacter oryziterrae]|uniref:GNAT family N-acetyltransferase n=1 Tax=Oryzibacter oryziterrae TaxID=2766474 RepID=UPI001F3C0EEE|nr:GNAT family N-acetyltransferase [Oryzibacter oryziterrae]
MRSHVNWAIRRAEPADASALAALAIGVWLHTYAGDGIPPDFADYVLGAFSAEDMTAQIAASDRSLFVCSSGERLLGFASLSHADARADRPHFSTELERLYVLSSFARCGIGRGLLAACESHLRERGEAGYWLRAYAGNEKALAFYDGIGFERLGLDWFALGDQRYENVLFGKLLRTDDPA